MTTLEIVALVFAWWAVGFVAILIYAAMVLGDAAIAQMLKVAACCGILGPIAALVAFFRIVRRSFNDTRVIWKRKQ
jgi:hypothetical protein